MSLSKQIHFDELPLEVYQLIFETYLNLNDLINLNSVNKKFNFIVKQCKVRELIFDNNFKYRFNWFGIDKPIDYSYVIDKSKLFFLKNSLFNVNSLLRLKIDNLKDVYKITLKHISQFVRLEILEIFLDHCKKKDNKKLSLPNLQILSFTSNHKYTIVDFDTPNLEILDINCYSLKNVKFSNPLKIKKLKSYEFKFELSVFSNIEYLEIHTSFLITKLVNAFPKLKEIQVEDDRFKNLPNFFNEKAKSKRDELVIYYRSYRLDSNDEYRFFNYEYYMNYDNILKLHLENYPKMNSNLNWVHDLDYTNLIKLLDNTKLNGKLPEDFFLRFNNIQRIYVYSKVIDPVYFTNFIANCKNLGFLRIQDGELNQAFYDHLPQITQLTELEIYNHYVDAKFSKLKLDFIKKMHHLKEFKTNVECSLSFIEIFKNMPTLKDIQLSYEKIQVCVEKSKANRYSLQDLHKDAFFKELNYNDLIHSFNYLKKNPGRTTRSKFKRLRTE